jgi:polyhydroxybutyrate depolymerase
MRLSPSARAIIRFVLLLAPLALVSSGALIQASAPQARAAPPPGYYGVTAPIATTGCGQPAPIPPGTSASASLRSGGLNRLYRLHLPPGYLPTRSTPLVLSFHGHGSSAKNQERVTGFSALADQEGFLVVYPQGTVGPDGKTGWATGPAKDPTVNDVLFVSDLLTSLQQTLCIDPQRVYDTGFSNGGALAAMLACTMASRIAAYAPVSGSYFPFAGGCHPSRPAPILEVHGTGDMVVPYDGSFLLDLPPVPDWLSGWAAFDGCAKKPAVFYHQGGVTGEDWLNCRGDATVVHYRIQGGKHAWPSTLFPSIDAPSLDATDLIWAFFLAHALPA